MLNSSAGLENICIMDNEPGHKITWPGPTKVITGRIWNPVIYIGLIFKLVILYVLKNDVVNIQMAIGAKHVIPHLSYGWNVPIPIPQNKISTKFKPCTFILQKII